MYPFKSVECYNPKMNCWEVLPHGLKEARGFLKVVRLEKKLYAVGGLGSKMDVPVPKRVVLHSVEAFDDETMEWKFVASMNQGRYGGGENFSYLLILEPAHLLHFIQTIMFYFQPCSHAMATYMHLAEIEVTSLQQSSTTPSLTFGNISAGLQGSRILRRI